MRRRFQFILAMAIIVSGCAKPEYDTSTPDAALSAMYKMIADGHPDLLGNLIHIQPRDVTFNDGVTEASAIAEVIDKAGEMLGQLYRVAGKLRTQFPDQIQTELSTAASTSRRSGLDDIARFLADPFGLMDQERTRISVEDLGDGTAAILLDGKPALGVGLLMREVEGKWKIDIPLDLMQQYRPNTREEWSVLANMMLSLENALSAIERELDEGQFQTLQQASNRAGRLLGERAFVQAIIYQSMKERKQPAS